MTLQRTVLFCIVSVLIFAGCQTTYYAMWEKLGKEKRHLLRDNVQKASDAQKEASEQFTDTLSRMKEMYGFEGGELEDFYEKFKVDFEKSEARADMVHKRTAAVEEVADDLFKEWQNEITQISNSRLRIESSRSLQVSKRQYARLRQAMRKAESKIDPVMTQFRDNLLYLKHNLNARAVGALKQEAGQIELEVERLIADMRASIEEAENFLKTFQ